MLTLQGCMPEVWARATHSFVASCGSECSRASPYFQRQWQHSPQEAGSDRHPLLWPRRLTLLAVGVGEP